MTGLASWSPYMFWMAVILGGGAHLALLASLVRTGLHCVRFLDVQDLARATCGPPEADRAWANSHPLLYSQRRPNICRPRAASIMGNKLFFWVMFFGVIPAARFRYRAVVRGIHPPWSLRWLRYLAVAVHVGAALILPSAHLSFTYTWVPPWCAADLLPSSAGKSPPEWARTHHRLWYEQVTRDNSPRQ